MTQKGVSVIVCTYNGTKRLPKTLRHLANQVIPAGLQWEVIVVDNNSNDHTFEAVKTEWASYNTSIAFTLARQPKPGVSYAREMGIEISRYAYLIQCDDDNWLAPDYVAKVVELLDNNNNFGIIGGRSTGFFEIEPPEWFHNFSTAYAVGQRRKTSTPINWLATAGVGIRRAALDELKAIGFQHILSGRKGKNLVAGDDLELCAAIRALGYEVYFTTELNFVHYMSANRLNWEYLKKMVAGQARPQSVFDMYSIVHSLHLEHKAINFDVVYNILWQQVTAPIKKRCNTFKKKIQFLRSFLSYREGDKYQFENRSHISYLKYLVFRKKEIKGMYNAIIQFYERVKTARQINNPLL